MNFPFFLAQRITGTGNRNYSKLIVRVAIAGITLGLAVMLLAVSILKGFKGDIIHKERGFNADLVIYKQNFNSDYESAPFQLRADTLQLLKSIRGVTRINAYATKPGIINVNDEVEGVVLKGIDSLYDQTALKEILVEGKTIHFGDSIPSQQQIMISRYTANRLNLKLGDDFIMYFVQQPLRKRKFKIVGIYNLGVEELDKIYVIGDIALIRRLNNWKDNEVGGLEVSVAHFETVDFISQKITQLLTLPLQSATVKELYPEIFEWLALLDVNSQVILILMILVAIINMISALLIMILERTAMIGILKALGLTNTGLRKVFLYKALYLIGIGMIFGNLLGIGLCLFQRYTHFFSLDEQAYYISYVPIDIGPIEIILLNVGTALLCLLALLIPSGLVSRISPIKAIRFK